MNRAHIQPGKNFEELTAAKKRRQFVPRELDLRIHRDSPLRREGVQREIYDFIKEHPGCSRLDIQKALHIETGRLSGYLNQMVLQPESKTRVWRVPGGRLHRYSYIYYIRVGARPGEIEEPGEDFNPKNVGVQKIFSRAVEGRITHQRGYVDGESTPLAPRKWRTNK